MSRKALKEALRAPQELSSDVLAQLEALNSIKAAMLPDCCYQPDFLSVDAEEHCMIEMDARPWEKRLGHATQDYGWRYDYRHRVFSTGDYLGPLPDWLAHYGDALVGHGHFAVPPDEVLANAYEPGEGINPHRDCMCFKDRISSITLNSGCVLKFDPIFGRAPVGSLTVELYLNRRSLFTFWGRSRYDWVHTVRRLHRDSVEGIGTIQRHRRVSLTFRNVHQPG